MTLSENSDSRMPWAPHYERAVEWLYERLDGYEVTRSDCESIVRVLWTRAYAVPGEERP